MSGKRREDLRVLLTLHVQPTREAALNPRKRVGILITAALFLQILLQVFFGDLPPARAGFSDLTSTESTILAALLALVVLIGVWPSWLLDLIGAGLLLPVAG